MRRYLPLFFALGLICWNAYAQVTTNPSVSGVPAPQSNVAITGGTINGTPIGGTTPAAGAFTTVSATGQITSTLANGTAPFVVTSSTNVANLNASTLSGATFAAPGAIGGGTASSGAFTTVTGTSFNGNIFTTGSSTYTGTAGQTYTFFTTTGTVARSDAAQTFTGVQTFSSQPVVPGFSSSANSTTTLSGNSTQIQMNFRNTDVGNAAQTRLDIGNNASATAFTLAISGSNHATTPSWVEIGAQVNAPTLLMSNGNDIAGVNASGIINGVNSNRLLFGTAAPTISSGFGTSPSILSSNGATTFRINVGTGGTATGGVLAMPTATTGWNCQFSVLNPTSTNVLSQNTQTSSTTTTVTIQNDLSATGAATAWPASTTLIAFCAAY